MDVHDELLGESLSELYENAPAGYLTTLADGAVVKANETFARWSGYSKSELVGGMTLPGLFTLPGRIYSRLTSRRCSACRARRARSR